MATLNVTAAEALASSDHSPELKMMQSLFGVLGLTSLLNLFPIQYVYDSVKLLVLGVFVEGGRRISSWIFQRFRIHYCITAQFNSSDPIHEWISLFMTEQNIWRNSRDFRVVAKSSQRNWGITSKNVDDPTNKIDADFIPTYSFPHLFRWKGYWLEVVRSSNRDISSPPPGFFPPMPGAQETTASLSLTIYTRDMSVLSDFIDAARLRYQEVSKPRVVVHTSSNSFGPPGSWGVVKTKYRRPLESLILDDGVMDDLLADAREFLENQAWHIESGIPYRRGYLMYGPPGSGKTSTIHTLAGELGLEIYSLSLSSGRMDDISLQMAVSSVPPRSILLIEDIDCAFPPRSDSEDDADMMSSSFGQYGMGFNPYGGPPRSMITLSGLLNAIDGVASEEGRLFFATTNHIDRIDRALLRPGRVDYKIEYKLASKRHAAALFARFFPTPSSTPLDSKVEGNSSVGEPEKHLSDLSAQFVEAMPEDEFTTAELQGFLLGYRRRSQEAVRDFKAWIETEREEKREREEKEAARKEKVRVMRAKMEQEAKTAFMVSMVQTTPETSTAGSKSPSTPSAKLRDGDGGASVEDVTELPRN